MVETDKKYVANIDFPTAKIEKGHKIHLNPYFAGSMLGKKILRHYNPEKGKYEEIEKHLKQDLMIVRWLDLYGAKRLIETSVREGKTLFQE